MFDDGGILTFILSHLLFMHACVSERHEKGQKNIDFPNNFVNLQKSCFLIIN